MIFDQFYCSANFPVCQLKTSSPAGLDVLSCILVIRICQTRLLHEPILGAPAIAAIVKIYIPPDVAISGLRSTYYDTIRIFGLGTESLAVSGWSSSDFQFCSSMHSIANYEFARSGGRYRRTLQRSISCRVIGGDSVGIGG